MINDRCNTIEKNEEIIKSMSLHKNYYAISSFLGNPTIFIIKIKDFRLSLNKEQIIVSINKHPKLNYQEWYVLGNNIFLSKEDALNKIIEVKQEKIKCLAKQFLEEKLHLESMLDDVEKNFKYLDLKNDPVQTASYFNSHNIFYTNTNTPIYTVYLKTI